MCKLIDCTKNNSIFVTTCQIEVRKENKILLEDDILIKHSKSVASNPSSLHDYI